MRPSSLWSGPRQTLATEWLHADHGPGSGASEVVTMFSAHDAAEFDALANTTD